MEKYVAYYRVSTNKQSLGLLAQRTICVGFAGESIIAEYEEKESGKNCNRPELEKAIELCKKEKAVLLVAKLDRLTRDLAFGSALYNSGVNFRALDCPELNSLTLGIMLGLAQREREMISTRTKQALAEKKAEGVKLGNPQNFSNAGRTSGANATRTNAIENKENKTAWALVSLCLENKMKQADIVRKLNSAGYVTPRGKAWTQSGLSNLINRMQSNEKA